MNKSNKKKALTKSESKKQRGGLGAQQTANKIICKLTGDKAACKLAASGK